MGRQNCQKCKNKTKQKSLAFLKVRNLNSLKKFNGTVNISTGNYSDKIQKSLFSRQFTQKVKTNLLQSLIKSRQIIQENFVVLTERKLNSSFALIHYYLHLLKLYE